MAENETLRIVLLGKTGSGKSRTGNTILGLSFCQDGPQPFDFDAKGSSVTTECSAKENVRFQRNIRIIDTPGVFDTRKSNSETQKEIKKSVIYTSPGPHALALCVNMNRFTYEDGLAVKHYIQHFGFELLRYVIIIFTHRDGWENDYKDKGKKVPSITEFIATLPDYPKLFLEYCEFRYVAFANKLNESEEQVRDFLSVVDRMIEKNNNTYFTNNDFVEAAKIMGQISDIQEIKAKIQDANWLKKIFYKIVLLVRKAPPEHPLFGESDYKH